LWRTTISERTLSHENAHATVMTESDRVRRRNVERNRMAASVLRFGWPAWLALTLFGLAGCQMDSPQAPPPPPAAAAAAAPPPRVFNTPSRRPVMVMGQDICKKSGRDALDSGLRRQQFRGEFPDSQFWWRSSVHYARAARECQDSDLDVSAYELARWASSSEMLARNAEDAEARERRTATRPPANPNAALDAIIAAGRAANAARGGAPISGVGVPSAGTGHVYHGTARGAIPSGTRMNCRPREIVNSTLPLCPGE
jgi:hypothetical protein